MNIINRVTVRNLKKNRTRTAVTIIGIILSAAMFTAVTTFVSSLQNYLIRFTESTDGKWYGSVYDCSSDTADRLNDDKSVDSAVRLDNIGYAFIGSKNEGKPFLFVGGVGEGFGDMLPVNITEGHFPQNGSEIILPKHLGANGGVHYSVGDTLTLSLGIRTDESGTPLWQGTEYLGSDGDGHENFTVTETRTYTVVGFYERPHFEGYSAPGYTALTKADEGFVGSSCVYIKTVRMKQIYDLLEADWLKGYVKDVNSDLLRFSGQSNEDNFNRVLYSLAGILIVIIMFGSVSLIYNAFSISVSERTKQFGLLKSVGATKRQIMKSVLFEAVFLSCIGVPIGVLAGIGGIGITLNCTETLFDTMTYGDLGIPLSLSVSVMAVVSAVVICFLTVLISAYIPARRAVKVPPIVAVKQTNDINIKPRKLKTPHLVYRLFGFEGMLADKNFKRNRKRYRSTVISLFLSIVLFISASSFCSYLTKSVSVVAQTAKYDIRYTLTSDQKKICSPEELKQLFEGEQNVRKIAYDSTVFRQIESGSASLFNKDFLEQTGGTNYLQLVFISDYAYEEYLRSNGLYSEKLMSAEEPCGVVYNSFTAYSGEDGKYHTYKMLDSSEGSFECEMVTEVIDGEFYYSGTVDSDDGSVLYEYRNSDGESRFLTADEANYRIEARYGALCTDSPFGSDITGYDMAVSIIYPYSAFEAVTKTSDDEFVSTIYLLSSSPKTSYEAISRILEDKGLDTSRLVNYAENIEANRAMSTIVNVFSYGFITLISLISVANVFNTISTNINLRRREFAMLKSVGMTSRGFNRMMNFECVMYGFKGLIYGIPVAIGVTYAIFRAVNEGMEMSFYIPWYSILISVGSVFAVVFATMLYSMSKIKKDNPIDTLKNENL